MTIVPVNQQNDALNQLLDRVENGEEIALMRDGAVVASLIKSAPNRGHNDAVGASERIKARRASAVIGQHELRAWIAEGRK